MIPGAIDLPGTPARGLIRCACGAIVEVLLIELGVTTCKCGMMFENRDTGNPGYRSIVATPPAGWHVAQEERNLGHALDALARQIAASNQSARVAALQRLFGPRQWDFVLAYLLKHARDIGPAPSSYVAGVACTGTGVPPAPPTTETRQ